MIVDLLHPELVFHNGLSSLFDRMDFEKNRGCHIDKFYNNLSMLSLSLYPNDEEKQQVFRGDMFEIFGEFFIYSFGHHPDINLTNYKPNVGKDMGVDGWANGSNNGKMAGVQFKIFNPSKFVNTKDTNISNFVAKYDSVCITTDNLDALKFKNIVFITTAKGLHWEIDQNMYHKRVRTLAKDHIDYLTKMNIGFWTDFKASICKTVIAHGRTF